MRTFIVCTVLVFCCLAIGCEGWAYRVPTKGMLPAIKIGDTCVINKYAYESKPIERFDIVVFNAPERAKKFTKDTGDTKYVKRVVGLSNEKFEIKDNKIFINDKLLEESFENITNSADEKKNFPPIIIPDDGYFLMGDNRPESLDSRYWQPATVKKEDILGKVMQIVPAKEN